MRCCRRRPAPGPPRAAVAAAAPPPGAVPLLTNGAPVPRFANLVACKDVAAAIGATPLVRLNRVTQGCVAEVYAKLEFVSAGGSVKDRIAARMIEAAEARGEISPERSVLIEATSGNTGVGIAMIAAAKGYRCILTMPRTPTMTERYMICRAHGAEVHLSEPSEGAAGFVRLAEQLAADTPGAFLMRQFTNEDNAAAHAEGTGPEIWAQAGGRVDVLVAGAGTGGTLVGVGRFLKQVNPNVHMVCVEAAESQVLAGHDPPRFVAHGLVGISAGIKLPLVQGEVQAGGRAVDESAANGSAERFPGVIDEFAAVPSSAGAAWAKRLAVEEGLLVGPSSGAACAAAVAIAQRPERKGQTIVVIFPSSGARYLKHAMFDRLREEAAKELPWCNFCSPVNWR